MSMRRLVAYGVAALLGIAIGGASALAMSGLVPGFRGLQANAVEVDGWTADFAIGSEAADPYTRARVARHGLLALAQSEAVYFVTDTDRDGEALREACTYRLTGGTMPAQWWSVTLYDADSRLPMNDGNALSIDSSDNVVMRIGDRVVGQEWSATVSPAQPEQGLWISSRNAGDFDLTLRLYVPDKALLQNPQTALDPPRVERLSCEEPAA